MSVGVAGDDLAARIERQLAAAQQLTHIGSWEWDMRTGVVTWSDELYRIYGFAPRSHDITFEWFLSRLHPGDRERISGQVQQALQTGGRFSYPERILRPDGSVRELETLGEAALDAAGKVVGLIGTCRDVTEERRREDTIRLYADIVGNVQIGLTVWKLDDPSDLRSFRLIACNPATARAAGTPVAALPGKTLPLVFPFAMGTALPQLLAQVSSDQPVAELQEYRFGPEPSAAVFAAKAFALPDHCIGLALEDVTERARGQRLRAGEQHALEMLAAGAPRADILATIVMMVEDLSPGTIGSVVLLDDSGLHLCHGAAPGLPEAYNRALDGLAIGPRAGSCGTAAFLRVPVYANDIATDPRWADYQELVRPYGLRACWSTPIVASDGRVLGTFAMYYREPRAPDAASLELIARATHVAGIVIERRQLDDQMRALSGRIEAIREDERTGIAREIHDELGQALTALKMDLAWVGRRLDSGQEPAREKLAAMSQMADGILEVVRRISAELRPGVLDDLGLTAAIEWQAGEFERRTGTPCTVRSTLGAAPIERGVSTAVFRIFQEALTNVARHAQAKRVEVALLREGAGLRLEVVDDGVGLPAAASHGQSLGLLGMRERARRLGGECEVHAREPHGTLVSLRVPLPG